MDAKLIKKAVKMQKHRDKVQSALNGLTDPEALSVLTMVIAEVMVSIADSQAQYDRLVNNASDFLHGLPDVLKMLDDGFDPYDSVKH